MAAVYASTWRLLLSVTSCILSVSAARAAALQGIPNLQSSAFALPTGDFGISQVHIDDKNSGLEDSASSGMGRVSYQAIGPHRGNHLASAAASIRSINATAAMALEAMGSAAFTGQEAYTTTLGTYLKYHGGKIMSNPHPLNVYLIYYGNWTTKARHIVENFVKSLDEKAYGGPKPYPTLAGWWAINTNLYNNYQNQYVTPQVNLAGIYNDTYSLTNGKSSTVTIKKTQLQQIVRNAVNPKNPKRLPIDAAGAYAILTGPEVQVQDFCFINCALHTSATFFGTKLAYAHVGNPEKQCPVYCTYRYQDFTFQPPNGDLGADAVADKLGHELAEIATNTLHGTDDAPGWCVGTSSTTENADLCEWKYGNINFEKDMSMWNLKGLNEAKYMVQLNFHRIKRECVLQYTR